MIFRCGLLMCFLSFATTSEDFYRDSWYGRSGSELDSIYSLWPSVHNAARLIKLRKRETQEQIGANEGGGNDIKIPNPETKQVPVDLGNKQISVSHDIPNNTVNQDSPKVNTTPNDSQKNDTKPPPLLPKAINTTEAKHNETASSQLDINNPGVLKRGLIVFGGFAFLAGAYFIWHRSGKKNDVTNSHGTSETNQFRYGVLQSDDRRDNMELSRIPLTMESDDDDDEDLEIFDLKQKQKSLSYVNLQTHEDDIVANTIDFDKDNNLLLDIEDNASDTLINWTNNANKSVK
ncbi:PREDICTED: uncharacterized protein LOC106103411 [Papilio polytes]|uniref:uncharacterized protein LOC106103411 n=1 Tax=Papilio polytes TaxID=76194 RepID=UPI000675F8C4|nr:PREDICTED: uncharacterized protein LOC106103411 [Papilio polytes]